MIETPYLLQEKIESYRHNLESKILVKPEDFIIKEPFVRTWYTTQEKFLKTKLGRLSLCSFKDEERSHICRLMNFERITSY